MEHVEDLKTWLMDGEDNCAIGVCQLVQVRQELKGSSSIQSCTVRKFFVIF